jgi:hypothetical protein
MSLFHRIERPHSSVRETYVASVQLTVGVGFIPTLVRFCIKFAGLITEEKELFKEKVTTH